MLECLQHELQQLAGGSQHELADRCSSLGWHMDLLLNIVACDLAAGYVQGVRHARRPLLGITADAQKMRDAMRAWKTKHPVKTQVRHGSG
jgi:hypothetical protein